MQTRNACFDNISNDNLTDCLLAKLKENHQVIVGNEKVSDENGVVNQPSSAQIKTMNNNREKEKSENRNKNVLFKFFKFEQQSTVSRSWK